MHQANNYYFNYFLTFNVCWVFSSDSKPWAFSTEGLLSVLDSILEVFSIFVTCSFSVIWFRWRLKIRRTKCYVIATANLTNWFDFYPIPSNLNTVEKNKLKGYACSFSSYHVEEYSYTHNAEENKNNELVVNWNIFHQGKIDGINSNSKLIESFYKWGEEYPRKHSHIVHREKRNPLMSLNIY